jgi:hypothetical protein
MKTSFRVVVFAVVAAGSVMLTGCGPFGSSKPSGPDAETLHCLPIDQVNTTLGTDSDDVREAPMNDVLSCVYVGGTRNTTVSVETNADRDEFDGQRHLLDNGTFGLADLPGFYDAAFTTSTQDNGKPKTGLYVLRGKVFVTITSSTSIEQAKALAHSILDPLA